MLSKTTSTKGKRYSCFSSFPGPLCNEGFAQRK